MIDKGTAWLILISVISLVVGGYLLAWRSNSSALRKIGSGAVAIVSGVAAIVWTTGYALPALRAFRTEPFGAALIANAIAWAICVGVWIIAERFAVSALSNASPNRSSD